MEKNRFSKQLQRKIAKMIVSSYEQLTMLRAVSIAARAKKKPRRLQKEVYVNGMHNYEIIIWAH